MAALLRKLGVELRDPDPWAVLLIAGLAAAVPPLVIYWLHWPHGFGGSAGTFTSTGQYTLWLAVLSAQSALWAVALIPLTQYVSARWRGFRRQRSRIAGSVVTAAFGLVLIFLASLGGASQRSYPLPGHMIKVGAIVLAGFAVGLLGVLAMALLNAELRDMNPRAIRADPEQASMRFVKLRADLQNLLVIEGALVAAAVLATSALRNAIVAWAKVAHAHPTPQFPPEEVLAYGAAFSALLALFWGPIYVRLTGVGTDVRDAATPRAESQSLVEWQGERDIYAEYLGLHADLASAFRAGVAILAPLLSASLGLLLRP